MNRHPVPSALAVAAALLLAVAPLAAQENNPSRDDRTLLRAEGADPHVLLVLDNAGSMTFDPSLNLLNFPAAGDHNALPLDSDGSIAAWLARYYLAQGVDFSGITDDGSAPTTDEIAAYLGNGAKLPQAREAVDFLMQIYPSFNYGFTYFEKPDLKIYYLSYLYEVLAADGSEGTTGSLLDGTPVGAPIRLGAKYGVASNDTPDLAAPEPVFPARFGPHGNQILYFYTQNANGTWWQWIETNQYDYWSPGPAPNGNPSNGDIRLKQCLSNAAGTCLADLTAVERATGGLFYYPAYNWSHANVSASIKEGLTGVSSWQTVANANWGAIQAQSGIVDPLDWSEPDHRLALRDWVVSRILPTQIASPTLYITERLQRWQNDNRAWNDFQVQITPIGFRQQFVLYDSREHSEGKEGELSNGSYSVSSLYNGGNMCGNVGSIGPNPGGFQDRDALDAAVPAEADADYGLAGPTVPIVPLSKPDSSTGTTSDQRSHIREYLRPQTTPLFYFPNTTAAYPHLPQAQANWLPFSQVPIADDRRPLKAMLNEAELYFSMVNTWDDPERNCRLNFVILISDGEETCQGGGANSVEVAARALHNNQDVTVYTVYFGSPDSSSNDIASIADETGGIYRAAKNREELMEALNLIAQDIEERTRGFSSPIVPSVESTTEQTAYISTFTPFQDRSVWRGHVRAYPIDPLTGLITGLSQGSPITTAASWDVGDLLAQRDFNGTDPRSMFFGVNAASGNMQGTRVAFTYPTGSTAADVAKRTFLGNHVFYESTFRTAATSAEQWTETADAFKTQAEIDADKARLNAVVNFIRGKQMIVPANGNKPTTGATYGRDPDLYGWCGVTGNVNENDPLAPAHPCDAQGAVLQGIEKLGDIFHSTPQLMGPPRCYTCWIRNIGGYRDDTSTAAQNDGFFNAYKHRRQVLFAAADDGAMHAFEAGLWDDDGGTLTLVDGEGNEYTRDVPARFDRGSGRELFAWVPQGVMGTLDDISFGDDHFWTVDGTPTVADAYVDRVFTGAPSADDREWRTLLLFGQRRGGRTLVALDITNPDGTSPPAGNVAARVGAGIDPFSTGRDPVCLNGSGAGCADSNGATVAWPSFRWEFTDNDLGWTWSRPLVTFIRTTESDGTEGMRSIAVFGGGFTRSGFLNPANKKGNFLYVLDVETGELLFKYETVGMVPGDVAILDYNLDAFPEAAYWGDTNGDLYRMTMTQPVTIDETSGLITNWTPTKLFSAGSDQPFFLRPTLAPAATGSTGSEMVIALGTGNRDDIFVENPAPTRFYVIADRPNADGTALTEGDLAGPIYPDLSLSAVTDQNFLSTHAGWYLVLDDGSAETSSTEKVNTPAVIVNNYVIFSSFSPSPQVQVQDGLCSRSGNAKTYTLYLYNANPPPAPDGQDPSRFIQHGAETAMATEPVVYVGADGKIHVIQALDNLQLEEPVESFVVPVKVTSWKEE